MDAPRWGSRLVLVVDDELNFGGSEATLAAAVTARLFPQLVHVGGDDALALIPRLFGEPEGDALAVKILEVLTQYARPITNDLLDQFYPYIVAYFQTVPAEGGEAERSSVRWLLIGYIRQLDGQDDAAILVELLHDPSRVSEAAEFYGRVLKQEAQGTPEELRAALEFWDAVLATDLPGKAFGGFGWWSEGDAVPDSDWLPHILATLRRANGRLDWDHEVVLRLCRRPDQPAAWEALALLVRGADERWTVAYWAGDLQRLLEGSAGVDEPIRSARNDLVEALVERELLDFRLYREEG
jgi:hypothetical protein